MKRLLSIASILLLLTPAPSLAGWSGWGTTPGSGGGGGVSSHNDLTDVTPNQHHTPTVDTNTNAETECVGTNVFLDGEGTCTEVDLPTHTGDSDAHHVPTVDTDTYVTGKDAHDHVGGDGAQIDHTGLANKGTLTHTEVETELTNLDNAITAVSSGYSRRQAVTNIVDNTAAPPTEVSGDRYILDNTGTSHADWDGAAANSLVQFNGTSWVATAPLDGYVSYVSTQAKDALYVAGNGAWELRDVAVVDHADLSNVTTSQHHVKTAIDDTPADGDTADGVSSNWAFDHDADANAHHVPTVDTDTFVTNKDSHDHLGGDGAQILHTSLGSVGANDHHTPTVDTFVTNKDSHDHVGGDGAQIDHDNLANVSTSDHHTKTAIEDTPTDANTTDGISSNWAYDHGANSNAHHTPTVDTFVTNKDAHDHVGGDGATLDHTNLTSKGTNTHAQVDTHLGDATKHRLINDSGTGTTDLWSADKISSVIAGGTDATADRWVDADVSNPGGQVPGIGDDPVYTAPGYSGTSATPYITLYHDSLNCTANVIGGLTVTCYNRATGAVAYGPTDILSGQDFGAGGTNRVGVARVNNYGTGILYPVSAGSTIHVGVWANSSSQIMAAGFYAGSSSLAWGPVNITTRDSGLMTTGTLPSVMALAGPNAGKMVILGAQYEVIDGTDGTWSAGPWKWRDDSTPSAICHPDGMNWQFYNDPQGNLHPLADGGWVAVANMTSAAQGAILLARYASTFGQPLEVFNVTNTSLTDGGDPGWCADVGWQFLTNTQTEVILAGRNTLMIAVDYARNSGIGETQYRPAVFAFDIDPSNYDGTEDLTLTNNKIYGPTRLAGGYDFDTTQSYFAFNNVTLDLRAYTHASWTFSEGFYLTDGWNDHETTPCDHMGMWVFTSLDATNVGYPVYDADSDLFNFCDTTDGGDATIGYGYDSPYHGILTGTTTEPTLYRLVQAGTDTGYPADNKAIEMAEPPPASSTQTVLTAAKVGVGTSTPSVELDVVGTINASVDITVDGTSVSTGAHTVDTFVTNKDSHDHLGGDGAQILHSSLGSVGANDHHTPTVDTNTNAATECTGTTTYLDGEGGCDDISTVYEAAGAVSTHAGVSDAHHTPTVDTDTNAATECTGTTTYLDGEGGCDDISTVYEASGAVSTHAAISDAHHTPTVDTNTNAATICTGTDYYLDGEGNCDQISSGSTTHSGLTNDEPDKHRTGLDTDDVLRDELTVGYDPGDPTGDEFTVAMNPTVATNYAGQCFIADWTKKVTIGYNNGPAAYIHDLANLSGAGINTGAAGYLCAALDSNRWVIVGGFDLGGTNYNPQFRVFDNSGTPLTAWTDATGETLTSTNPLSQTFNVSNYAGQIAVSPDFFAFALGDIGRVNSQKYFTYFKKSDYSYYGTSTGNSCTGNLYANHTRILAHPTSNLFSENCATSDTKQWRTLVRQANPANDMTNDVTTNVLVADTQANQYGFQDIVPLKGANVGYFMARYSQGTGNTAAAWFLSPTNFSYTSGNYVNLNTAYNGNLIAMNNGNTSLVYGSVGSSVIYMKQWVLSANNTFVGSNPYAFFSGGNINASNGIDMVTEEAAAGGIYGVIDPYGAPSYNMAHLGTGPFGTPILADILYTLVPRIGMGTATPGDYQLHVVGDAEVTGTFTVNGQTPSTGAHTTDTSAATECTGTTTYLDGEGTCDDLSTVYEANGAVSTHAAISDAHHTKTGVDDIPADADVTDAISSNWAFDHDADANAHHTPTVDTNTNAQTICDTGEFLDGDGNCVSLTVGAADTTNDLIKNADIPVGDPYASQYVKTPSGGLKYGDEHSYAISDDGSFATVHRTAAGTNLYQTFIKPDGTYVVENALWRTTGSSSADAKLVALPGQNKIAVVDAVPSGGNISVWVSIYDADLPAWSCLQQVVATSEVGSINGLGITALPNGNVFLAWNDKYAIYDSSCGTVKSPTAWTLPATATHIEYIPIDNNSVYGVYAYGGSSIRRFAYNTSTDNFDIADAQIYGAYPPYFRFETVGLDGDLYWGDGVASQCYVRKLDLATGSYITGWAFGDGDGVNYKSTLCDFVINPDGTTFTGVAACDTSTQDRCFYAFDQSGTEIAASPSITNVSKDYSAAGFDMVSGGTAPNGEVALVRVFGTAQNYNIFLRDELGAQEVETVAYTAAGETLGVGTATPNVALILDVVGDVNVTGTLDADTDLTVAGSSVALDSDLTTHAGIADAHHTATVDTNTNAATECTGTTTYLDGEGGCDDISTVYEASGAVSTHNSATTSVHGISDTSELVTNADISGLDASSDQWSDSSYSEVSGSDFSGVDTTGTVTWAKSNTYTATDRPVVVEWFTDGSDRFIAAGRDNTGYERVYIRQYNGAEVDMTDVYLETQWDLGNDIDLYPMSNGNMAYVTTDGADIRYRQMTSAGTGSVNVVYDGVSPNAGYNIAIAQLTGGNIVIATDKLYGIIQPDGTSVLGFNSYGTNVTSGTPPNIDINGNMGGGVDIVPLSDGGWVIFYNGGGNVLYMARFASDGQTVSYGPTSVQTGIHSAGNIEAEKLVGGDVVLVYSMNADAPHFKIINPISWTQGSAIQLSDANITTFYYAGVSATSDGGFIAPYWTGLGDVYVNIQHFSASGVPSAYTAQWIHTLTNAYRLGFAGQGPDNVMTIVANYGGGAGGSVQTRYGVGAGSTVLTTIASDGTRNVGIGTSTPAYELDLVGDLNISGAYRVNGTAAATGPHINVDDTPADGDTADAISSNWAFDHDADAAAHHTATVDTNANTICTGDTTYLDGEGNCDDISSVYAPAAPVSRLSAISTKTGDYTMTTTDFIVLIDATSNNVTITLPAVSGNSGLRYKFKRLDNQDPTYTVTIDANSTETIDGAETKTITTQYGTMEIVCDGSAWYIM